MQINDLLKSDTTRYLVDQLDNIDLSLLSDHELIDVMKWAHDIKKRADFLTLEDEFVGFTYNNLDVIMLQIDRQQELRGISFTKKMQKRVK